MLADPGLMSCTPSAYGILTRVALAMLADPGLLSDTPLGYRSLLYIESYPVGVQEPALLAHQ